MNKLLKQISIVWTDFDIEQTAKEMGYILTEKEISDVLSCLDRKHDAEIGVNWEVIKYWIEEIVNKGGNNGKL
jgi:hypothetical protein